GCSYAQGRVHQCGFLRGAGWPSGSAAGDCRFNQRPVFGGADRSGHVGRGAGAQLAPRGGRGGQRLATARQSTFPLGEESFMALDAFSILVRTLAVLASLMLSAAAGFGGSLILVRGMVMAIGTMEGIAVAALLLACNNLAKV